MKFNCSSYFIDESDGKVDVTLNQSNPSSVDIMLIIYSEGVSAYGK